MGIACPLALVFLVFLPFGVLALHSVNRRPSRQFTIRGMMLFIFLWAACLSQIAVFFPNNPTDAVAWGQTCFAWIVLAVFYVAARQFAALLIHSTGVLFFVCFFAIGFVLGSGETWNNVGWCFYAGMFFSSFLSLIFFSLMMLLTILRRPLSPPRKENHQP